MWGFTHGAPITIGVEYNCDPLPVRCEGTVRLEQIRSRMEFHIDDLHIAGDERYMYRCRPTTLQVSSQDILNTLVERGRNPASAAGADKARALRARLAKNEAAKAMKALLKSKKL